jgi:riboflavin kinase/FMN adenylyltransferase
MELLESISELERVSGPVHLGIGVFDGVHLGHQAVIRSAMENAARDGGSAVAVTFDPHPARILRPDAAPRLLTSARHKQRLIAEIGIPYLLKIRFDEEFAALEPEEFINALVQHSCPLRTISVGHDWVFGRMRRGNVAMLKSSGETGGFRVVEVPSVQMDGLAISSTRIRRAVQSGDLDEAARFLGRRFSILGGVEEGKQLGRTIGFPTANLDAPDEQFPPDGVYAVRARWGNREATGMANIGVRPTVNESGAGRKLEAHLFEVNEDLYGADLDVEFIQFLRSEMKFPSLDALKSQLHSDRENALSVVRS